MLDFIRFSSFWVSSIFVLLSWIISFFVNHDNLLKLILSIPRSFIPLVTPGVVILEYILDKKILSTNRTLTLVAVCSFVLISSRADLEFSTYGTICASLWVPLAAGYKVQWGRVKKQLNCSTLQLMHAILPYGLLVQCLISPLVDPPGILDFKWTKEAVFWISLSGLFAFLVNFSGFLVMGNIGALAHVLLGQLKTAVIMVGSTFLFGSKYSTLQIGGALGAVVSILAYTHVTMTEKDVSQFSAEKEGKGDQNTEILPLTSSKSSSSLAS